MGVAVGAGEGIGLGLAGDGRGFGLHLDGLAQAGFDLINLCHDAGELFLEIALGGLVVVVGELADPVFELKVAEVFVDRGLAFIEVGEGRDRLGFREILRANAEDEDDDNDRQDAGNGYDHGKK